MTYDQGNNAARNAPTNGATSGNGASASARSTALGYGTATTAGVAIYVLTAMGQWDDVVRRLGCGGPALC